jgi:hypothetical protein
VTALEVRLYDTDGATPLGVLARRRGLRAMEEFNGVGFGQVTVPAADAAGVAYDQVVKVAYGGTEVAGFVVESKSRVHIDDNGLAWVTLRGGGLLAWLEDAVVYPAWGLKRWAPVDRPFNFAGRGGNWEDRVTWTAPEAVAYTSTATVRKGYPRRWPDRKGKWIWKTDPASSVAADTRNWFRSSFTLAATTKVRFYVTADNQFSLYVDGTLILKTSDLKGEGATWKKTAVRAITLEAGTHYIAVAASNGGGSETSLAGLLVAVTAIRSNGKPGKVLRRSDATNWYVTDDEPRWYPAEIVEQLYYEADTRGVDRIGNITIGWTDDEDSSGRDWSTAVALKIRCGTNYLDVIHRMVDLGIDFWLDPATNTLEAYETRGTNRATSVLLKVAKNLATYETTGNATGKTFALVRSADRWTSATNSAGVSARGRRETFLEFGNLTGTATPSSAATRILARTAAVAPIVERVSAIPTPDARPFLDFAPGDRVTAPSSSGGVSTARVLSITLVEDEAGLVTYEPELEVLA